MSTFLHSKMDEDVPDRLTVALSEFGALLTCVISGFGRDVDEICALLRYYAAHGDNSVPTFRRQPIGPIFKGREIQESHLRGSRSPGRRTSRPLKMGPIGCPETSVRNYLSTLCNIPEERRTHTFNFSMVAILIY